MNKPFNKDFFSDTCLIFQFQIPHTANALVTWKYFLFCAHIMFSHPSLHLCLWLFTLRNLFLQSCMTACSSCNYQLKQFSFWSFPLFSFISFISLFYLFFKIFYLFSPSKYGMMVGGTLLGRLWTDFLSTVRAVGMFSVRYNSGTVLLLVLQAQSHGWVWLWLQSSESLPGSYISIQWVFHQE